MNHHFQNMCCLCLTHSNEQVCFNELNSKCNDNFTHLDKIAASLLELSSILETDCKICNKCTETVDFIYNFNKTCIKNIKTLTYHKKLLHENKDLIENEIEFEAEFISENESNETNEDDVENEDREMKNLLNFEINLDEPESECLESETDDLVQSPIQDSQSPENLENFTCHLCKRKFRYKSNLRLHLKVHAGEKSFKCHLCGKSFLHRGNLNRHLLTHTGLKLYQCEFCDKSFARKNSLDTHRFSIHGQVGIQKMDNPNELKYALVPTKQKRISKYEKYITALSKNENEFENVITKSNMTDAEKVMTKKGDFGCDECGKMFNNKSNLKIHLMIHTGERPFQCFICEKSFIHKGNLNRHLLTHTSLEVYKCDKCEKTFTQKNDFEQHLFLSHNVQKVASEAEIKNRSMEVNEEDLEDRLVIDEGDVNFPVLSIPEDLPIIQDDDKIVDSVMR